VVGRRRSPAVRVIPVLFLLNRVSAPPGRSEVHRGHPRSWGRPDRELDSLPSSRRLGTWRGRQLSRPPVMCRRSRDCSTENPTALERRDGWHWQGSDTDRNRHRGGGPGDLPDHNHVDSQEGQFTLARSSPAWEPSSTQPSRQARSSKRSTAAWSGLLLRSARRSPPR